MAAKRDGRKRRISEGKSKFEKWVYGFGGTGDLANALDISRDSVVKWVGRKRMPNLTRTLEIVKLSKGKLSAQDIYNGTKPL